MGPKPTGKVEQMIRVSVQGEIGHRVVAVGPGGVETVVQEVRTTAQLREAAQAAEGRLEWAVAASLWAEAAERYPRAAAGSLGERDVRALLERAAECRGAAGVALRGREVCRG